MVRFPEKRELILLTDRAPQLETPLHYFRQDFTPNEAFFVRWHVAGIPTHADTGVFELQVDGHAYVRTMEAGGHRGVSADTSVIEQGRDLYRIFVIGWRLLNINLFDGAGSADANW
jgi:hypothetical protein